jgi:hypothetical protein
VTKFVEFPLMVSYSQVVVFVSSLERPFNEWTGRHVAQGFSWRPGSVAFRTIEEAGHHLVITARDASEREPRLDAIRIIDVPFEVPLGATVEIGSISDCVPLELPSGIYQLRFECYERDNNSPPRIRFLFSSNNNPNFNIVRADSQLTPDIDLLLTASPA